MLIESVTLIGFGAIVALLIVIALELRETRKSFDSLRAILADAVGTPLPDLIDAKTAESGSVTIPQQLKDLLYEDGIDPESRDVEDHA